MLSRVLLLSLEMTVAMEREMLRKWAIWLILVGLH